MTWTDGNGVTHNIRLSKDRVVIKTRDYNAWETIHGSPRLVILKPLTACGIHGNDRELHPRRVVDCMTCLVREK